MVGWETSNGPVRSHTHAWPPSNEAMREKSRSRIGSDSALNTCASFHAASASAKGSRTRGEQQAAEAEAVGWITGRAFIDMRLY